MKRRRLKLKTKVILLAVVAAVIALAVLFFNNASNVIISVGTARLRAMNTAAVTAAVESVASGVGYDDIITVTYGDGGNISAMSTNSARVNAIARTVAYNTQTRLTALAEDGAEVPLGAFSGIEALSGYGRLIHIKLVPIVSVQCSFLSRFASAGINQTLHSIYIDAETSITIVLASRQETFTCNSQILICESVINGKVPEIYLNSGSLPSTSLVP